MKLLIDGGMLKRLFPVGNEDQGAGGGFEGVIVLPGREIGGGHDQPHVALGVAFRVLDGDHYPVGVELHPPPGEPAEFADAAPGLVEECDDRPVA